MIKRINKSAFIWTLILILIFYSFARMIYSGDIRNYIHPDMVKYTIFGTLAIFLMVLCSLGQIFKESSHEKIKYGYLLFMLPVLIYLLLKPSGLSESTAINRGVNLMFYKTAAEAEKNHNHNHDHGDGKMLIEDEKIIVENSNFFTSIKEIFSNVAKYKDTTVEIKGFALREKGRKNGFILSRMVVSCCAADIEVIGVRCEYNFMKGLSGGEWVQVSGKFKQDNHDSIPYLIVDSLKIIEKPKNNYIYRD